MENKEIEEGNKEAINHFFDALKKSDAKIVFGLEAQGHIPTIENKLKEWGSSDKYIWEQIGKEIGWCPFTACAHYVKYLQNKTKEGERNE